MSPLLYAVGVVLLLIGVSLSIALHELGHLLPAKRFGVKVTRYMIGFGPTLFSFRRGETEYGIKALPLGGFIAMPGMYPPEEATRARIGEPAYGTTSDPRADPAADPTDHVGAESAHATRVGTRRGRPRRGRLFERSMREAREFSNEELAPGEEHRAFYSLNVPRRLAVMFGGPVVNLILGIGIMAIVLLGIGFVQPTTTVTSVVECAVPASEAAQRSADEQRTCDPDDPVAPAWEVGLEPGDRITAIDGQPVDTWDELASAIAEAAGRTIPVEFERDGTTQSLDVPIIASERVVTDDAGEAVLDEDGQPRTEVAGFLGVSPTLEMQPMPPAEFPGEIGRMIGQTFTALVTLPQKLVEIGGVAFTDAERDPEGPIGMVGVGRVAGEIVGTDRLEIVEKAQVGLSLLGSLNLFLFAFNMVPLLPLDGGHIAVALYEGARRRISILRGRGLTGPFDTARLLPLTYGVVGVMLCMTALLLYVDIVEPVRLFG